MKNKFTFSLDSAVFTCIPENENFYSTDILHYTKKIEHGVYQLDSEFYLKEIENGYADSYRTSYRTFLEGEDVGILSVDHSRNKKLVKYKPSKYLLYCRNWGKVYAILSEVLELKFNNIAYIEIALDSNYPYVDEFGKIWEECTRRKYAKVKRYKPVTKVNVHSLHNNREFIIGSKDITSKAIRAYIKTNFTPYQQDMLRKAGFDDKVSHRLELRCGSDYLSKIKRFDPYELTDLETLIAIWKYGVGDTLNFHDTKDAYYDKNRNKKYRRIELIDLSIIQAKEIDFSRIPIEKPQKPYRQMYRLWKDLIHAYIREGHQDYLNAALIVESATLFSRMEKYRAVAEYADSDPSEVLSDSTVSRILEITSMIDLKANLDLPTGILPASTAFD